MNLDTLGWRASSVVNAALVSCIMRTRLVALTLEGGYRDGGGVDDMAMGTGGGLMIWRWLGPVSRCV